MSKSIVRRFLPILGSRVIGVLAMFLATPLIVRILDSARYGDYAFVLSLLGIIMLFVDAGVYDGIRKYLKESGRSGAWPDRVFGFYSRVAFVLVALIVVVLVGLVQTGVVRTVLGERFELYVYLVALVVITKQAFAIARSTLMGFDREDVSESLQVSTSLITVGLGVTLLLFGFGVPGLIAARACAYGIAAFGGFVMLARYVEYRHVVRSSPEEFPGGKLLSFNLMSVLLFALYLSIIHVDVILIQFFYGSEPTGHYKAALNLAEFVWFVPRIVQVTLVHSTSELWSEERDETITELSARVTRYTLLFATLLVIGLGALAEPTVAVYYGEGFSPAVTPLVILLPGALGFAVARPILAIGQGKGEFRYLVYATGAASVLNLVLNLLLIPRFGIAGAAMATSTGYFSMFVFHVGGARAIGFDPIADLRLPNVVATIAVAAVAIFVFAGLVPSVPLSLLVVPPVGLVIYTVVAVLAGAVSIEELRELRDRLPT